MHQRATLRTFIALSTIQTFLIYPQVSLLPVKKTYISNLLVFRTEKIVYIYEKTLQCEIKPRTSSIYMHVDNLSNNYACGMLMGCLTYHKWIAIWHLCKQQNYPMECHPLWHFIISYKVYFSIIISYNNSCIA